MSLRVLRDRNVRVFLIGQATSMFGTTAMIIVLAIWVKDLTGSDGAAGVIFLLLAISVLLTPLSGLVVDRMPRRRLLVVNDIATAVLVASLVTVHDRDDVWLVYLVAFGYGWSGQVYRAARGGLLHSMVHEEQLGDVNGLMSSLSQGMRVLGPVVGAAVYSVSGGPAVALMDTATFLVSAGSYLLLWRVPDLVRGEPGAAGAREPFRVELMMGLRHVVGNPVIRRLVVASAVAFTGAGMINVATFALVDQGLNRPAAIIGVLGGVQGAGSVLAGVAVGRMLRRYGEYATASVGFLLNGAGLILSSTTTLAGALAGAGLVGLGLPLVLVAELTVVQRRTPGDLQGRAITASEAIINVPFALSIGTGALIIATVGFRPIYLAVAAGFTVVGLVLLRYVASTRPAVEPRARTAPEPVVDASSG